MKFLCAFLILTSFSALARQYVPIEARTFEIRGTDALLHLEDSIQSPGEILEIFQPAGGEISRRVVRGNEISFVATKRILFLSKSVRVHGILDSQIRPDICPSGEVGHQAIFDLSNSDAILSDSYSVLETNICLKELTPTVVRGRVMGRLYLGNNYSRTLGPSIRDVVEAQVPAFIKALESSVQKRQ